MVKINSKRTSKLNNSLSVEKKLIPRFLSQSYFTKKKKKKLFYQSLHVFEEIICTEKEIILAQRKMENFQTPFKVSIFTRT